MTPVPEKPVLTPHVTAKNGIICILLCVAFFLLFVANICREVFVDQPAPPASLRSSSPQPQQLESVKFACPAGKEVNVFGLEASIVNFIGMCLFLTLCCCPCCTMDSSKVEDHRIVKLFRKHRAV